MKRSLLLMILAAGLNVACGLIAKEIDTTSKVSPERRCRRILTNTQDDDTEKMKEDMRKLKCCLPPLGTMNIPRTNCKIRAPKENERTSRVKRNFPINSIRKCLMLQEGLLTEGEDVDQSKFRAIVLKDLIKYPDLHRAINKSLTNEEWPYPTKPDYNPSSFLGHLMRQCVKFYTGATA